VLETHVDIHLTCESELARISELSQRTNQCTNGIRYTVDKLQQLMYTENYRLYSVLVSDRFSDLGLVGAIGICGSELDLFSLSCRSLGRNVEDKMFDVVRQHYVSSYRFNSTNNNDKLLSRLKNMFTERKVHY
jgi:FkbH-like protein